MREGEQEGDAAAWRVPNFAEAEVTETGVRLVKQLMEYSEQ